MSAQYLAIYLKPQNQAALTKLMHFVDCVNKQEYGKIAEMDVDELLDEVEHYFDTPMHSQTENGVVYLKFETFTSFDVDLFVEFLFSIGADEVEASVYNSQVGEYAFYKNSDCLQDYSAADWQWIEEPQEEEEYDW